MNTLQQLETDPVEFLTDARGIVRDRRKVAHNTYAHRVADGVAIRLHATDVVTFTDAGTVRLDSGGWRTVTTRDRQNRYAPAARVNQSDGVTWVTTNAGRFPFVDGFEYRPDTGEVLTDPKQLAAVITERDRRKEARKQVRHFLRMMTPEEARHLGRCLDESDFAGDCLLCRRTTDGDVLGDAVGSPHVSMHVAERYYVPLLFVNALRDKYGDRAGFYAYSWVAKLRNGVPGGGDLTRVFVDYLTARMLAEGWPARDV